MKEKIARWYRQGLWTAAMVSSAVDKGILTEGEKAKILGGEGVDENLQPEA